VFADVRRQGREITPADVIETAEPLGPCAGDEIFARFRFAGGVNGFFESRRGMVPKVEGSRMGITVCGTEGMLALRYSGGRELRICRDFPVPVEDSSSFETVELPPESPIPGALPLVLEEWGLDPAKTTHRYFTTGNRNAAWDLIQAIREKREPEAGIVTAVRSLEMIMGVYRSSLCRAEVKLPPADLRHPLG